MIYAGFWRRLGAYLVDGLILGFVGTLALIPFGGLLAILRISDEEFLRNPAVIMAAGAMLFALICAGLVVQWLYYATFESSIWQATPGKRALGIFVTDEAGRRISFARASGRYFGKIINHLILNIGYLIIAFTARKQGLHDIIAGTLVLRRPTP